MWDGQKLDCLTRYILYLCLLLLAIKKLLILMYGEGIREKLDRNVPYPIKWRLHKEFMYVKQLKLGVGGNYTQEK